MHACIIADALHHSGPHYIHKTKNILCIHVDLNPVLNPVQAWNWVVGESARADPHAPIRPRRSARDMDSCNVFAGGSARADPRGRIWHGRIGAVYMFRTRFVPRGRIGASGSARADRAAGGSVRADRRGRIGAGGSVHIMYSTMQNTIHYTMYSTMHYTVL